LSFADKENFKKIDLTVSLNNRRAISLYKKFGFTECGFLGNNDKWKGFTTDSLAMVLYLDQRTIKSEK